MKKSYLHFALLLIIIISNAGCSQMHLRQINVQKGIKGGFDKIAGAAMLYQNRIK